MKVFPGLASVGLAVGLLLSVSPANPAAAADPPVLTITSQINPKLPQQVASVATYEDAYYQYVGVHITTTAAAEVTVTASNDTGLVYKTGPVYENDPVQTRHVEPGGGTDFGVEVQAPSAGFHQLTFTATAAGADPVTVTLPRLWLYGERIAGTDSLGSRMYTYQHVVILPDTNYSAGYSELRSGFLNFFDPHKLAFQPAINGSVTCGDSHVTACNRYDYDKTTGLLEYTRDHIGFFDDRTAYISEGLNSRFYKRLVYPKASHRYAGTWKFRSPADVVSDDLDFERLTLTKRGTFALAYRLNHSRVNQSGTYQIGKAGRLVLTVGGKHRHQVVDTLVMGATQAGSPAPHAVGAYLYIHYSSSGPVDHMGYLMAPVQ